MHHQAEARAVLQRAAEGVGAPVGARRQELADQMAAGHGLAAVEPAFLAAHGGSGVVGDDAVDVVAVHLARDVAMAALADRGRRHGRQPVHRGRGGAPAEMRDLAHDRGAMAVDARREGLQVGDDGVARHVDLAAAPARIARHHRGAAEHGERDAALGLFLVVALVALLGQPALVDGGGMAGAHDAVAQGSGPSGGRAAAGDRAGRRWSAYVVTKPWQQITEELYVKRMVTRGKPLREYRISRRGQ